MKKNKTNFKYNLNKLLKNTKTHSIKTITEHPVYGPTLNTNNTITQLKEKQEKLKIVKNYKKYSEGANTLKLLFNIHFIQPKELSLNEYNTLKKEINGIIKKLSHSTPKVYIPTMDPKTQHKNFGVKLNFPTPGIERAHTNKGILCRQGSGKGNILYYYYMFTPNTTFMNLYISPQGFLLNNEKFEIFYLEVKQELKTYPYLNIDKPTKGGFDVS